MIAYTWHHCEDNQKDCKARIAYMYHESEGNLNIAAHLLQDSYSPPHWDSFEDRYRCHTKPEKQVDNLVGTGYNWEVRADDCLLKDGSTVDIVVNQSYLDMIKDKTGELLVKYQDTGACDISIGCEEEPLVIEEPKKRNWILDLIEWIKGLFSGL